MNYMIDDDKKVEATDQKPVEEAAKTEEAAK